MACYSPGVMVQPLDILKCPKTYLNSLLGQQCNKMSTLLRLNNTRLRPTGPEYRGGNCIVKVFVFR